MPEAETKVKISSTWDGCVLEILVPNACKAAEGILWTSEAKAV